MLDIKYIRENEQLVRQAVANRQSDAPIDDILKYDKDRRAITQSLDELRYRRKEMARQRSDETITKGRELREQIKTLENKLRAVEEELNNLLLQVPNIPDSSVPIGKGEEDDKILRNWGDLPQFDFKPAPHWKLGEDLGIIDFERGVKLSGTRFYVLSDMGARLQRSLINFMLDIHTSANGYREIYPPFMVKRQTMVNSGNLPKFADNLYHDDSDDFWFVPTAEVPLTSLFSGEILAPGSLPIHYAAHTACFRREKMSAGKDTRGIKRGHQFDKVELYKLVTPQTSEVELEKLLTDAEGICRKLKLSYRIRLLCTAEIGFQSKKSYDIEIWASGLNEWLEVSSCSNCGDFQARRAGIRFRAEPQAKAEFIHTLNGSGLALPRLMIAIMENYQRADGSIAIPEVLIPYMGTSVIK